MLGSRINRRPSTVAFPIGLAVLVLTALVASHLTMVTQAGSSSLKTFELNTDNNREWDLRGTISFKVANCNCGGFINTGTGSIIVHKGDTVEITINQEADDDENGKLWIGSDGWVSANQLEVTSIRINGSLVAEDTTIYSMHNILIDMDSLESSLYIYVYPSPDGWTSFEFNGTILINGNDGSSIKIVGLTADETAFLNIHLDGRYASGLAGGSYVNEEEVPEITPFALVFLVAIALIVISVNIIGKHK